MQNFSSSNTKEVKNIAKNGEKKLQKPYLKY